jgi:hypothetical protein
MCFCIGGGEKPKFFSKVETTKSADLFFFSLALFPLDYLHLQWWAHSQTMQQGEKRAHSAGSDDPKRQRPGTPVSDVALFQPPATTTTALPHPKVADVTQVSSYRLTQLFAVNRFVAEGGYGIVFIVTPTAGAIASGVLPPELADRQFVLKVERESGSATTATEATVYALIEQSACPKLNVGRVHYWTRVYSDSLFAELTAVRLADLVTLADAPFYSRPAAYSVTLQEKLSGPALADLYTSAAFRQLTALSSADPAEISAWNARAAAVIACITAQMYAQMNAIRRYFSPDFTHGDAHAHNLVCDSTNTTTPDYWVLYELEDGDVLVVPLFVTGGAVLRLIDFGSAMGHYMAVQADGTVRLESINRSAGVRPATQLVDAVAFILGYVATLSDKIRPGLHQLAASADSFAASCATLLSVLRDDEFNTKRAKRAAALIRRIRRLAKTTSTSFDLPTLLDLYTDTLAAVRALALLISPIMANVIGPAFERANRQADFVRASATYTQTRTAVERSSQARLAAAVHAIQEIKHEARDDARDASVLAPDFYAKLLSGPIVAALRVQNYEEAIRARQLELVHLFRGVMPEYGDKFNNIIVSRPPATRETLRRVETRM